MYVINELGPRNNSTDKNNKGSTANDNKRLARGLTTEGAQARLKKYGFKNCGNFVNS